MDAFCRALYGVILPHSLNVETALLPVKAEPAQSPLVLKLTGEQMSINEPAQVKYTKQLKAAQWCLCYYQSLLDQLLWFHYKKAHFGNTEAIESLCF